MPTVLRVQDVPVNRFGSLPFSWTVTEIPAGRYLIVAARTDGTTLTFSHAGSGSYTAGPTLPGIGGNNPLGTYISPVLGSAITEITATHGESNPFIGGIIVIEMDGPVTAGTATANSDSFSTTYSVSRDATSASDVLVAYLDTDEGDTLTNTSGSGTWYGKDSYDYIFVNSDMGAAGTKTASCSMTLNRNRRINAVMFHDASASPATLSSPTSASVTQTGATIGATTDDATGTLYGVVTTSASAPSATQIKAGQDHTGSAAAGSGSNASLTASANNTIAITGLTAATTYYYYLVQDNGSDSNVVNGTFTTAVAAPTLTSPTAVSIGTTTVTPRVTTDTGNGTCYYVITPQAESEPSNTQVEAGTNAADGSPVASGSTVVSGTPPVVVTFSEVTGLTAGTAYRISYAHSGTPS